MCRKFTNFVFGKNSIFSVNMYYFLGVSHSYPNSYWLEYDRSSGIDSVDFLRNERIELPLSIVLKFQIKKNISLPKFLKYDYLQTDASSIISERLANIFREVAPNDVQLIPVEVYVHTSYVGVYYLPIFLKVIDCIDWDTSVYDAQYNFFKKIVILPDSLGENNVVKAKGDQLGDPIVNESFYSKCMEKGICGCKFYKNPYINPLFDNQT